MKLGVKGLNLNILDLTLTIIYGINNYITKKYSRYTFLQMEVSGKSKEAFHFFQLF